MTGVDGVDRRLPAGDEIFLDHIAHFVADADAAAQALAQAGFTTTPQSIQVNPDTGGGPPQPTIPNTAVAQAIARSESLWQSTTSTPCLRSPMRIALDRRCEPTGRGG